MTFDSSSSHRPAPASLSARNAESVVEGQTARVPASFLRALAAYRFRDHDSMQSALGSLIGQLEHLSPGQRAVAAGLLRSAGREIEAFRLRENVNEALLLPEELALLGRNW